MVYNEHENTALFPMSRTEIIYCPLLPGVGAALRSDLPSE